MKNRLLGWIHQLGHLAGFPDLIQHPLCNWFDRHSGVSDDEMGHDD